MLPSKLYDREETVGTCSCFSAAVHVDVCFRPELLVHTAVVTAIYAVRSLFVWTPDEPLVADRCTVLY